MHRSHCPRRPARRAPLLVLAAACLVLLSYLPAAVAEGLHSARVEVRGQGADAREDGFRQALREVVVRLAGRSDVLTAPELESLLEWPGDYVQTFRYRPIDEGERRAGSTATHYLEVTFAGSRIERALIEREIPVWSGRRPETLLWVAVDDGTDRYIVGAEDGAAARAALREEARHRGLPLLFPLLDIEDRQQVEYIDIQGGFLDVLERSRERYRTETLLVGHVVRRDADQWRSEWTLLGLDGRQRWDATARSRDEALAAGVEGATDRLAAALAGDEVQSAEVRLRIQAVESLSDYARIIAYLNDLTRVRSAHLERLTADSAQFRVRFDGDISQLERSLSLGSLLVREALPEIDAYGDAQADDELDALVDSLTDDAPESDRHDIGGTRPEDAPVDLVYRLVG